MSGAIGPYSNGPRPIQLPDIQSEHPHPLRVQLARLENTRCGAKSRTYESGKAVLDHVAHITWEIDRYRQALKAARFDHSIDSPYRWRYVNQLRDNLCVLLANYRALRAREPATIDQVLMRVIIKADRETQREKRGPKIREYSTVWQLAKAYLGISSTRYRALHTNLQRHIQHIEAFLAMQSGQPRPRHDNPTGADRHDAVSAWVDQHFGDHTEPFVDDRAPDA